MRCEVKWCPCLKKLCYMQLPVRSNTWILGLNTESRETDAEIYRWIWTNPMARTAPRSRKDLVLFIFKIKHSPHTSVQLNHLPSHTSSPRNPNSGGQSKEQPAVKNFTNSHGQWLLPFHEKQKPSILPSPWETFALPEGTYKLLSSLKLKGNLSKVIRDDLYVLSLWAQEY